MPQKFVCSIISELKSAAKSLLECNNECRIFLIYGQMGAGKTTLIQTICSELGVQDHVSSPTFSIVNEYRIFKTGKTVYHMDFYRIKNSNELINIGIDEYLYSGSYCFIEWPEIYENSVTSSFLKIKITVKNEERIITF